MLLRTYPEMLTLHQAPKPLFGKLATAPVPGDAVALHRDRDCSRRVLLRLHERGPPAERLFSQAGPRLTQCDQQDASGNHGKRACPALRSGFAAGPEQRMQQIQTGLEVLFGDDSMCAGRMPSRAGSCRLAATRARSSRRRLSPSTNGLRLRHSRAIAGVLPEAASHE